MSVIDWIVLGITLAFIVLYGMYRSRGMKNVEGYLLADRELPWYHVGLSVMATQASAITFISAPGQAYHDGLRFIQFYFGLPLAMIVLCVTFIPVFQRLNVYTAYEFLEKRFDSRTRFLTAFLFLLQRGLSTGITIYAPSIILSTILGVDVLYTTLLTGGLVILYTVYGGTKAVSHTQLAQMLIIFSGMILAAVMVVKLMPEKIGLFESLHIAGKLDRLNAIDTSFDWNNRYNIWSGIIGGFFLQLSYFGTDQSQVGRYLTGKNTTQSRLGLVMNGLIKIPMQFFILMIGVLVFSFYQFHESPVYFNRVELEKAKQNYPTEIITIESEYREALQQKKTQAEFLVDAIGSDNQQEIERAKVSLRSSAANAESIRQKAIDVIQQNNPRAERNDSNYVFLTFVTGFLPTGLVGLIMAIIFLAAMGSTASGLNSLASTTVVDFHKRLVRKEGSEKYYLNASRWATVAWGAFCVVVAIYAGRLGNLIEAVNILGSLFYGTILGIFLVAFYLKNIQGKAVFFAAIIAEVFVIISWQLELTAFLWLNVTGCVLVVLFAWMLQRLMARFK
jgi:solute:Na+ symporter, SSS family